MNCVHYKFALFATTVLSLGLVAPAFAQEEEIIVTARRVEERLQDVPISITVFNQKQLSDRNITTASDLAVYTPNLSVANRYSSESSAFTIRGFTQEARTTASVGVYFADVVSPRAGQPITVGGDGAGPGNLFDLQNVQVLKGPQGTLFGRNTTGGAVLFVPKKPSSEFGGYVEGSYGNFDMKRLQGVVNVPLGSKARMRLGFDRMTREGYLNNVSPVGPRHFANTDYIAGRASLVVDITPDIENYTIASIMNSDNNGLQQQIFQTSPTPLALGGFGVLAQGQVDRLRASGDPYQVENDLASPEAWTQQWQLINTTTWRATDLLTVKNIASYSVYRQALQQDFYGSNFTFGGNPVPYVQIGNDPNSHGADQYGITEELQLQGRSGNDKFNWQFGLYYEQSTPRAVIQGRTPIFVTCTNFNDINCVSNFGASGQLVAQSSTVRFRNMGIYGQGTYALTEQLKLTAGMRFTHDETDGVGTFRSYKGFPPYFPPFFITPGPPNPAIAQCGVVETGFQCFTSLRSTSDAPTWVLDLQYSPTQDLMTYVKYSRGYRQGAVNPFAPEGYNRFGPETVEVYEIGAKSSFHGRVPGYFNVAVFYNDFANQQTQATLRQSAGALSSTIIVNAGGSRMYGAEIESSFRLFPSFKVDASASYLSTKVTALNTPVPTGVFNVIVPTSQVGDPLPYSPKYRAVLTGTYTLPVPDTLGTVEFAATYAFQSSLPTLASYIPNSRQDATNLVNLNLNWLGIAGGPVDASFFVTNLLDEVYTVADSGVLNSPGGGYDSRLRGQPRMFGGRLRLRFGSDARS